MIKVKLANGCTICSDSLRFQAGGYVQILNAKGEEIGYWDVNEWAEDPEFVMGAILGCAQSGLSADQQQRIIKLRQANPCAKGYCTDSKCSCVDRDGEYCTSKNYADCGFFESER